MAIFWIEKIIVHSGGDEGKLAMKQTDRNRRPTVTNMADKTRRTYGVDEHDIHLWQGEFQCENFTVPWVDGGELIFMMNPMIRMYVTHFGAFENDSLVTVAEDGTQLSRVGLGVQGTGSNTIAHLHYNRPNIVFEVRKNDGLNVADLATLGNVLAKVGEVVITAKA